MISDLCLPDSYILMSFEELRSKFSPVRKHFSEYLQLRSFVKVNQNNALSKPFLSPLEERLKKGAFD